MTEIEPTCALNLRKFPKALRKRLNRIAVDLEEDIQDFAPRWLGERVKEEELKLQAASKKKAKQE
ncbi:MAG: hypothetical protein ABR920_16625 [Terriglobales bacterium]